MSVASRRSVFTAVVMAVAVAALPAAAEEAPAPDLSKYDRGVHIVRPGENLHYIARKYLGDKGFWPQYLALNPQIEDPHRLTPGQRIEVLIERQDSVPTARLRSVAGRVEEKPSPIAWKPARELDLMLEEDGLRTGRRSSTEMEFQDGTSVLMTEDSVVYLRRRGRRLVGQAPRAVEIVEGQAEVEAKQPAGSEREIEILVGGTRAVSRPDASGVAQTRARRSTGADAGAKVMVYEGGGEVESGGQKVAVARGMGTSVQQGRPPAPPEKLLPPPTGLVPEAGARLTFNDVELAWQPVAGAASYTVELCRDAACARLVERRTGLAGASWAPEAPVPGEYFWRVTAVSASGLDGYPSPGAALAVLGGPDRIGPTGSLAVIGRQVRYGQRLLVDENVQIEPRLEDAQSGVAGWRPIIDGAEVPVERWDGPWPDGTYRVSVRAVDRVGNESLIAAAEPIVVDALPPVLSTGSHELAPGAPLKRDRSRCGWLVRSSWRWRSRFQCRWERRAAQRWLRQGWNWLETSVDGQSWNPLLPEGSEPARAARRAGYRLPASPAMSGVHGAEAQLLVRLADGSPLLLPGDGAAVTGLRIRARDPGVGVERLELRAEQTEPGVLVLSAEAVDVLGHSQTLRWRATPGDG